MQSEPKIIKSNRQVIVILCIASCLLLIAFYFFLPVGHEYSVLFRPAALRIIHGESPYEMQYYNSPWLLLLILPFALLTEQLGFTVFTFCGLLAFSFIAIRCKVKPWLIIPILFSYPVAFCLYRGQVDWLVLLGIMFPPQYGLLLVLSKPQIGIGIAVYWCIEAFRTGGIKRLVFTIMPALLIYLCSAILFGLWFLPPAGIENNPLNVSLWPESIPIGLAILVLAIRKSEFNFSILASPFFSPYLSAYSLSGAIVGLSSYPFELIAVSIGTWIWRIIEVMK